MPRTINEIINQAEEMAAQFEQHDPGSNAVRDATALREVRNALIVRAEAERHLVEAVQIARTEGHSWGSIGAMLGTSGEAARQRYR